MITVFSFMYNGVSLYSVLRTLQDTENVRQLCSHVAQRLNVRHRVRFASSLVAAALDDHFEHPASRSCTSTIRKITARVERKLSFSQPANLAAIYSEEEHHEHGNGGNPDSPSGENLCQRAPEDVDRRKEYKLVQAE